MAFEREPTEVLLRRLRVKTDRDLEELRGLENGRNRARTKEDRGENGGKRVVFMAIRLKSPQPLHRKL